MALQEGTEADQRHAVLAMQGASDFFEHGVEHAVSLLFGEIGLFRNGGGEFWFTHSEASLTVFLLLCRAALQEQRPRHRRL
ncbi:hypothetical protein D3C72_2158090 [compost metagenome]